MKSEDEISIAPTVEESFEVLRISYGSAHSAERDALSPHRASAIRYALPDIYDPPTQADLTQSEIAPGEGDEVRVAHYDFERRKEISVYNEDSQAVVTLIFDNDEEPTLSGARGTKISENAVIWLQSPDADFAGMSRLLSLAYDYVGRIE
ncbi:MAG: hypothetical protein P1U62_14575 [Alteraurantiacibacter sp. bin_em_oilr2.035]|nr:hypothetical protein [Alteraurantiacibacter sp. bin_em_oilr2.035]